MAELVGVSGNN